MPESKQCVECDATFFRPAHRSHVQWASMRCCSTRCANTIRAREATAAGANFKGSADHGHLVRMGWALSPAGQRAARKQRRKVQHQDALAAERHARQQLSLWLTVCSCGSVLLQKGQRFCDVCNLHRKRQQRKLWNAAHPEYQRLYKRGYAKRKALLEGHCTHEQAEARFHFYGGACAYCRASLGNFDDSPRLWHWDHVIPLSRNGTNWPANLRPACAICNQRKAARDLAEFRTIEGRLPI